MKFALLPLIFILVFGTTSKPSSITTPEIHEPIAPIGVEILKPLEPIELPKLPFEKEIKPLPLPKPVEKPSQNIAPPEPVKPAETPRQIGQRLAAEMYGWTDYQWVALEDLWTKESGWRPDAQNPYSTAYGIAQFLDSTWGLPGMKPYNCVKTSNASEQIRCGLIYIKLVYHTPAGALNFWHSKCGTHQGCHY